MKNIGEEDQLFEAHNKATRKCKYCGAHHDFLRDRIKAVPCPNCGNLIYRNDKVEFKEKIKKELRKNGTRLCI